ncbi:MAG: nucleotidyltransferase domain-containing protein [Deltaproteobacteria bacterium]|nr:nucleotidyltransferase domain-containing protein [Deltaproteobacteria bacterium]
MENILNKIVKYLSHEKPVTAACLFGSTAKGKSTGESDIDLGLLLKADFDLVANFDYKLRLMGELKDITGKAVDVVFINTADPILQYEIRKHGKLIFERDKQKRIAYEILARKRYFDFLPMHKKYIARIMSKL